MSSTEDMKMDVENSLTRLFFGIEDDPVAAVFYSGFVGYGSGFVKDMAEKILPFLGKVVECSDVVFGNDKDVDRRLGIDILKREDLPVFVDHIGRDLFLYDTAKDTVFVIHGRIP